LLTFPTAFDDAVWTKLGLNAFGSGSVVNTTATTDPIGGNTAEYIQENTVNTTHGPYINGINLTAAPYTFTVYCKAAQRTWVYVRLAKVSGQGAYFNLSSGTVGTVESGITAAITSVGNEWYRCSVTITVDTSPWYPSVQTATGDNQGTYTGDGTSGIFIWGAQLEIGSTATAFQNIGTDKMTVFAGVRKLSDANAAILVEYSANFNGNPGSFFFTAPESTGASGDYGFAARGSASAAIGQIAKTATRLAPITDVVTVTSDIAGDLSAMRVNGVASGTNGTADQGTGNYGNYPLFIGARNGAGNFFSGHLYSLIVRGARSNTGQISSTETWVAGKTGITI
jgi:hypothetical protein